VLDLAFERCVMTKMPKSPEPTAVPSSRSFGAQADGAVSSAVAVRVASRSTLRSAARRTGGGSAFFVSWCCIGRS
jgi:hypothetical protein